jgi:hypothetical protein
LTPALGQRVIDQRGDAVSSNDEIKDIPVLDLARHFPEKLPARVSYRPTTTGDCERQLREKLVLMSRAPSTAAAIEIASAANRHDHCCLANANSRAAATG